VTETEARDWVEAKFGARAVERLDAFAEMVRAEACHQNLISASTLPQIWARHIVDSAQLVPLAGEPDGLWMDIGTGAGFPGIVTAILTERATLLVEPRKRRVEFLASVVAALKLEETVSIAQCKAEAVRSKAGIISARAVAQIGSILSSAVHCATRETVWILPKGRNAAEEVAFARLAWHGTFHVEHSLTDPTSFIVIANGIARR
jgi:16S rRNA (guanine527-N7)-methyltransferase